MSATMTAPVETLTTEQQLATTDEPGDASHIVMVPTGEPDQTPQAYVLRATIEGFPVTALCGYTWVPGKDPKGKPVCGSCKEIFENDPNGFGDRGELPDA